MVVQNTISQPLTVGHSRAPFGLLPIHLLVPTAGSRSARSWAVGRRGPAPETLESKLARGETRPSRINKNQPKPRLASPIIPRDMDARAKAVWRRILRDQAAGIIRAVDGDLLRAYCEAVSRYAGAVKLYRSPTVEGANGGQVANPLHRIIRDNSDAMRLLARELGIGPAARAGLEVVDFGEGGHRSSIEDEIGPAPRFRAIAGGKG